VNDQLTEADELALAVVQRLEANELLSTVALAAHRLAEMRRDVVNATWLEAEISGLSGPTRPPGGWSEEHLKGQRIFFRLRSASLVDSLEELAGYVKRREPVPKSGHGLYAPLAGLELVASRETEASVATSATKNSEEADLVLQRLQTISEAQRILVLVRQYMHQWAGSTRARMHSERHLSEMLGPDAVTVFSAGGTLLDELSKAVDNLRPGMQATAAIQSRTALLTLGRELYKGDRVHTSPITGEVHQVNSEKHALFAFLDDLWTQVGPDRKLMIEKAIAVVDAAHDLGSKAKNPTAITSEEAEVAVRHVYAIARAICFAGWFPPREEAQASA
jgi:hypothetical protein